MRRIFVCGILLVCSGALGMGIAQGPARSDTTIETDAIDRLLADFAAATANLDIVGAERLFLPPDGTAAAENRQNHIAELREDWARARNSGASAGPSVQFTNTRKVVHSQMRISGPGAGDGEVTDVEFVIAFTRDGWKIVSMKTGESSQLSLR
jgi:hypothetical protein